MIICSERTTSREADFRPMTGIHQRVSRPLRKNIYREKPEVATSLRDAMTYSTPQKNGTAKRRAVNNGPTNRSKKRESLGFRLLCGLDGLLLSRGFRRGFFGLLLGVL